MNPLNVILASVLKWLLCAGALSAVIAGISVGVTKIIKRNRKNSEINSSKMIYKNDGNEKQSKKLYGQTKGITSTPEREEPSVSELEKRVRGVQPQAETSNIDRFIVKGKSKVLSSVQDPRLVKLIEEYVHNADLKSETEFSKIRIEHAGEVSKKSEILVAPDIFVKTLFIPKICYECAITEDQKYPVVLTYQPLASKNGEEVEVAQMVIESRDMATEYAVDFISQMKQGLAAKADMDLTRLTEIKNRDQDSSK